jgi:hypothetical protein
MMSTDEPRIVLLVHHSTCSEPEIRCPIKGECSVMHYAACLELVPDFL